TRTACSAAARAADTRRTRAPRPRKTARARPAPESPRAPARRGSSPCHRSSVRPAAGSRRSAEEGRSWSTTQAGNRTRCWAPSGAEYWYGDHARSKVSSALTVDGATRGRYTIAPMSRTEPSAPEFQDADSDDRLDDDHFHDQCGVFGVFGSAE